MYCGCREIDSADDEEWFGCDACVRTWHGGYLKKRHVKGARESEVKGKCWVCAVCILEV